MSCKDSRNILTQSVEKRTALPASVVDHFQACSSPECRETFAEYQLLDEAISQWTSTLPHVDLVAAVVGDLAPQPTINEPKVIGKLASSPSTRVTSAAAVAVVGAVLSLCLILMVSVFSQNDQAIASVEPPAPPVPLQAEGNVAEEDMEAELRELGKNYGTWVQGAAHKLTDTMTVVLLDDQSQAAEKTPGWFSNISEQMEPLETKLDETFKMLMEQVSVESDEQTYVPANAFEVA